MASARDHLNDLVVVDADLQVDKWQVIKAPVKIAAKYGLGLFETLWRNPDGDQASYVHSTKKDGFTVCPVTTDGDLIIVEQFKQAAALSDIWAGPVLEFPAGIYNPPPPDVETDQVTLRRNIRDDLVTAGRQELAEETGYDAEKVIVTSPAKVSLAPRKMVAGFYTLLATNCTLANGQTLDPGEHAIRVYAVPVDLVVDLINEGSFFTAESLMAFYTAILTGKIQATQPLELEYSVQAVA